MIVYLRQPSSDLLFDPSEDILALGNCTVEQATSCPQCGTCTCSIFNVAHLPDLTKQKVEWKINRDCPLHGMGAHHPMADVYDEPRILASLYEEEADRRQPLTNVTMERLFQLEKFEQGRWGTPQQLRKAMTSAYGHCELAHDDGGSVIVKCFAKNKQGVYLGHLTHDDRGYYIHVVPGRKVGGVVHKKPAIGFEVETTYGKPWSDPDSDPIGDLRKMGEHLRGTSGYSARAITGARRADNHGTGIAMDVNFEGNPFGKSHGEAMHFELDAAAAARLTGRAIRDRR